MKNEVTAEIESDFDEKSSKTEKSLVLSLFSILFLVYTENFVIAPLLVQISQDLAMSVSMSSNLVSVYTLSVGFGALLFGPISDKIGRYKSVLLSLYGFALATFFCAQVNSPESAFVLRALCGGLAGILVSNTFAYVADYCIHNKAPNMIPALMGKVMSGMFAAIVFGVPFGMLAGYAADWRVVFVVLGVATLILAIVFNYSVENVDDKQSKVESAGYLKSLSQYFAFLKNGSLARISLLFFTFQFVVTAFATFSPIWILDKGYSLMELAIVYGITGFISTLVAVKSGLIVEKFGVKKVIVISNLVVGLALLLMVTLEFSIWLIAILISVYLSFVSLRMSPLQALSSISVSAQERGRFMALNSFSMQVGSTVGVFILSIVMTLSQVMAKDFEMGVYLLAFVSLISLLISMSLKVESSNQG